MTSFQPTPQGKPTQMSPIHASDPNLRLKAAKRVTLQSPLVTRWLRRLYGWFAGNGYSPLRAAAWILGVFVVAWVLIAFNREDITPTDPVAATQAVKQHFGLDHYSEHHLSGADIIAKQEQASKFIPVTADTTCDVLSDYPCMNSLVFAINAVLTPIASHNRDWDISSDGTLALTAGLPALKALSWFFVALLLAGVTGLIRKN